MCGLAGCLNLAEAPPPARADLERPIALLRHRGPDDTGFFTDGCVGLAHARLSIIDPAGGRQPVHNEDRTVWVVFNGEIFNYLELRAGLAARGHSFYTASDTEVLVHLYEERGERFVEELNGQFAVALWDARARRLVLARDRVGIRPLFYARVGARLWFASEVKALLSVPGAPRRLSPRGLAEVFTFWSPLETTEWFEGVRPLPPGCVLSCGTDGSGAEARPRRYWDWSFPDHPEADPRSLDACAEELRGLLVDAVRLQLRADVPVGAYLSGGLDSSVIATLIRRYTDTPLRTFSLAFAEPEFDESAHQDAMVAALQSDHSRLDCSRRDIAAAFPRVVWHAEVPLVRTAPAPLMLLAGLARRQGYKVVLTGEGADEVFAGYDLFKEAKVRRFWARRPDSTLRPRILERLYPYLASSPTAAPAFARSFFAQGLEEVDSPLYAHLPRWAVTRRAWRLFSPEVKSALEGWDPHEAVRALLPPEIGRWPPLARAQYVEAHTLLGTYLLSSQGDRMAMASSIEARFPFLDHRVIEFAARLPPEYKLFGLKEKHVLKRSMIGLLPDSVRGRSKQPYRAPDSASFFDDGVPLPYVRELLAPARVAEAGYFDPAAVGLLVKKCARGAIGFADNMAFVGVLSTMLLDQMMVRGLAPIGDRGAGAC
jgi:asparagine synthase (glutamine-hydrolysing)